MKLKILLNKTILKAIWPQIECRKSRNRNNNIVKLFSTRQFYKKLKKKSYDLDHFITLFLSQNELNILLMDNNNKNEVINQDLNPWKKSKNSCSTHCATAELAKKSEEDKVIKLFSLLFCSFSFPPVPLLFILEMISPRG